MRDKAMMQTLLTVLLLCAAVVAQADVATIQLSDNLIVEGIPAIPVEIAEKVAAYTDFRPNWVSSWHPKRRELLIHKRHGNTTQVHRVAEPGASPEPLTDFPDAVNSATYAPDTGDYFLFTMGRGGNEVFRIYRYDLATHEVTPLSPENERASAPVFSYKGERIVYTTAKIDRYNAAREARTDVHIADPLKPETDKVIATFDGGGWSGFRFSRDVQRLVFMEYRSANESHLWVMDIATGEKRHITPETTEEPVSYLSPRFARHGKSVYATSDRGSEFRHLVHIDLATGEEQVLTEHLKYDVEEFTISDAAKRLAFVTNENGSHVLRLMDLETHQELPRPALLLGQISGLRWNRQGGELAFNVTSARAAGDVFSYNPWTNEVTRWTNGNTSAVNPSEFAEPQLIKWQSFDGLEITGFHYHPSAKFTGKRPVIVSIHGGPEGQAQPGFIGRNNYYVNELGIALIYPNVRGSSGFGKTFLKLDNGMKREDAVKDIGALLAWIAQQPNLDTSRVMVMGGSYGGYMSLAVSVHYADRIVSAIDAVGISNFVSFLERTESYRRDLRRVEYGDERDPTIRAFLENISPLNHADRITKPLFVVQGLNDPRVPYTEAEQVVATLKKNGTPVWFLMAKDEGHGFAKKSNADFLFYASVEFVRETLLK
jgi:dipeptidyl aminopeptidase/acylaminoacyl peptidase